MNRATGRLGIHLGQRLHIAPIASTTARIPSASTAPPRIDCPHDPFTSGTLPDITNATTKSTVSPEKREDDPTDAATHGLAGRLGGWSRAAGPAVRLTRCRLLVS